MKSNNTFSHITHFIIWVSIFVVFSCSEENNEEWTLPDNYESLIPDSYFHFNGGFSSSGASVSLSYEVSSSNNLDYWRLVIKKVEYYIDNDFVASPEASPYKVTFSSSTLASGNHKFIARVTIGGTGKKDVVKEQVVREFAVSSGGITSGNRASFWIEYDQYAKRGSNFIVVPHIVSERSNSKYVIKNVDYTWDGVKVATKTESPFQLEYKVSDEEGSTHSLGLTITCGGEGISTLTYQYSIGGIRVMDNNTASHSFTVKSSINSNSEYEYKNGETLSAIAKTYIGEKSTTSFSLKVYLDDTLIGESSTFPYNMDYKIENQNTGIHVLKLEWIRTDGNQGGTTSQSQTYSIKIID